MASGLFVGVSDLRASVAHGLFPPSEQSADPRGQCGSRGKYDQQLQQLALQVVPVLSSVVNTRNLREVMLEKAEPAKQEPVEEDHVIGLVDRKDRHKAQEELNE